MLILFLLVGGTYTLGIMPKTTTKNRSGRVADGRRRHREGQKQTDAVSPARYNKLVEEIRQNEAAYKQLTSTKNNLNEELLPSNMPGHQDSVAIAETLYKFFGDLGFNVEISLGRPVTTSTKKVYTISSAYKTDMQTLYKVTDAIARVKSYNLTYLSMTPDGNDVSGTFTMTITYILNE